MGNKSAAGVLTYCGIVYPWQCDHMGHMNVMWYVNAFDQATWILFASVGISAAYVREEKHGMAAVQQHVTYKKELVVGDVVAITSRILEVREKAIRLRHELANGSGDLAAVCELTGVHLDLVARRARALPADVLTRARAAAGG